MTLAPKAAKALDSLPSGRAPAQAGRPWAMEPLDLASRPKGNVGEYVVAFGEDADGELYVMTNNKNALILPATAAEHETASTAAPIAVMPPTQLS